MLGLKEIAKQTGVSISTVSNVLNGRKNVGEATRERILQFCREHGYIHPAMKNELPHTSSTVMFIFSDFDRDFYMKIIEGVSDCLEENGFDLIICTNKSSKTFMNEKFARGTISLDGSMTDEDLIALAKPHFPVVLMDRIIEEPHANTKSVVVDNYPAMYQFISDLVDQGFRRFGFLGGIASSLDNKERYAGFLDALAQKGLAFDERHYYHGNYREASGYQAAKLMMLSHALPEILICANDNMAIGAIKAFEDNGIRVPEDISVTGFDDSDAAALAGLTTLSIPRYESGYLAAKELLEMIKGTASKAPVKLSATVKRRNTVKHKG